MNVTILKYQSETEKKIERRREPSDAHSLLWEQSLYCYDQGAGERGVRCKVAEIQWLFYELILPSDLIVTGGTITFLYLGTAIVWSLLQHAN